MRLVSCGLAGVAKKFRGDRLCGCGDPVVKDECFELRASSARDGRVRVL
jgi:hypothetical protein